MAGDWKKQWTEAKKYFKETTGKKKPDANVDAKFLKHAAGLEKLVGAVDSSFSKAEKAKAITQTDITKFQTAIGAFVTGKNSYLSILEKAIETEISDKDGKTVYSKACKYLGKQLEAMEATMETQVDWLNGKLQKLSLTGAMAGALKKSLLGASKKCAAAIAQVKTKPTKDNFDKVIYTPARDLSQYLGNVGTLRKKGEAVPAEYDDQTAKALYDLIRPYGTEELKKKLPDNADSELVLTELKKFSGAVKAAVIYINKA
jgi:hypothetical protein